MDVAKGGCPCTKNNSEVEDRKVLKLNNMVKHGQSILVTSSLGGLHYDVKKGVEQEVGVAHYWSLHLQEVIYTPAMQSNFRFHSLLMGFKSFPDTSESMY